MPRPHTAVAFVLFVLLIVPAATVSAQDPTTRLPVVLHVATRAGEPVATDAWLAEALERADGHFRSARVGFSELRRGVLPEAHAELRSIRDRHRLKRFLVPRAINVFVVDQILDPVPSAATRRAAAHQGFEPSGRLSGAHVRAHGRFPDTYIIVSRRAAPLVVTHELGHFLGAPHHRDPVNIMSYGRERQRFNERQLRTFRHFARRHIRRGSLRRPPRLSEGASPVPAAPPG